MSYKKYNIFLEDIKNKIEEQLEKIESKGFRIQNIQDLINKKEKYIDKEKYEDFLNFIYKSNNFELDKEFLKNHLSAFLESFIVTLVKNAILKVFVKKIENEDNISKEDLINILLFLNIFFRYKKKQGEKEDIYKNVKRKILSGESLEDIKKYIIEKLKENYFRANVQINSIFQNQLVKYLKQKRNKIKKEILVSSNDYQEELISFQQFKNKKGNNFYAINIGWGEEYNSLKEEIIEEVIEKYKRKRVINPTQIINDIRKIANKKVQGEKKEYFNNFIEEIIENLTEKFKILGI